MAISRSLRLVSVFKFIGSSLSNSHCHARTRCCSRLLAVGWLLSSVRLACFPESGTGCPYRGEQISDCNATKQALSNRCTSYFEDKRSTVSAGLIPSSATGAEMKILSIICTVLWPMRWAHPHSRSST